MLTTIVLSFLLSLNSFSGQNSSDKDALNWSYVTLDTLGVHGLNNAICPVMQNGSIWYTQSDVKGKMHVFEAQYSPCGLIGAMDILSFKESKNYIHLGPAGVAGNSVFLAASTEKESGLQIVELKKNRLGWKFKGNPSFTNKENNFTHPALSMDGSELYFVSDMPGTIGGTDVFKVKRKRNSWGKVEHLGAEVNSDKNELFPSIAGNGTLFYSSDKDGDLNIYQFYNGVVEKLPAPINSEKDDFGITIDRDLVNGLFTSNRSGVDMVYSFSRINAELFGKIIDAETKEPIQGCEMVLNCGAAKFDILVDASRYGVILAPNNSYIIEVSHPNYKPRQIVKSTNELENAEVEYFVIELTEKRE